MDDMISGDDAEAAEEEAAYPRENYNKRSIVGNTERSRETHPPLDEGRSVYSGRWIDRYGSTAVVTPQRIVHLLCCWQN